MIILVVLQYSLEIQQILHILKFDHMKSSNFQLWRPSINQG